MGKSITRSESERMMALGQRLFDGEKKKFNGIMKFAFLRNDITGEMIFYSPNATTSRRIQHLLNTEFNNLTP